MPNDTELLHTGGDAQVIVDTAQQAVAPKKVAEHDGTSVEWFAVPQGVTVEAVDRRHLLPAPLRKQGTVLLHTGASLGQYVNAHKVADVSALYADVEARRVVALLNDHEVSDDVHRAGWGDHRAFLSLRHTPAWQAWTALTGKLVDQVAFAEHIEDNLLDVIEPAGAELLELAQTFQAASKVAFKSHRRLDSGEQQLVYEETIDAKAGQKGQITIPDTFTLGIAPFEGCDPYKVTARLRYRIRDGQLLIGYVLNRIEDIVRTAFDEVLADIEAETGLTAYRGVAPDAR